MNKEKTVIYDIRTSKKVNMTQEEFANALGLKSKGHVSGLENGTREITDRIANDICRIFGVRKEFIQTRTGEMFKTLTRDEQTMACVARILSDDDRPLKAAFLSVAAAIIDDDNCYNVIESTLLEAAEMIKKNKTE